jgi:hypothetical protein
MFLPATSEKPIDAKLPPELRLNFRAEMTSAADQSTIPGCDIY